MLFTADRDLALQDEKLNLLGLEHPVINKMLRQYTVSEAGFRAIIGKLGGLTGSGLLTIWKVTVQGKDGQANLKIVKIGLSEEGSRAPWLERIEDDLLKLNVPVNKTIDDWRIFAANMKQRIVEILHRELLFSGLINDDMSYSAIPLAIIGIETG